MLRKNQLQSTIDDYNENDEIQTDEIIERILLLSKLNLSEKQIDEGKYYTQEEVEIEIKKWEEE